MSPHALPPCRHRGEQFAPDRWICRSPKLVIPGGVVTAELCRLDCPYVDHADDPRFTLPIDCADCPTLPASVAVAANPDLLAVAMITAPRPVSTVERSLFELRRAGFGQTIFVFEEPGSQLALQPGVRVFANPERLGPWGNWCQAARRLLELTDAPFLLICEDDVSFRADAALGLMYAMQTLPQTDWGYASLYTPWHNVRRHVLTPGWQSIAVGANAWGALAYCFTRSGLQELLHHTKGLLGCGDAHTDLVVTAALSQLGRRCYFHVPSLCDHTGESISSLGHWHLAEMAAVGFQPDASDYVPAMLDGQCMKSVSATRVVTPSSFPSVSVIVATYNCGAYLGDCLRSLERQTVSCQVVVVDDGSTDDTARVLGEFSGRVRVLRHERNRGANAARNTGLKATTSEWVVMADADAVYAPHYLERLLEAASQDVALVYGPFQLQDVQTGRITRIHAQLWNPETLWWGNYISMCSLVRRAVLPAGLPEDVTGQEGHDDWKLWLDLASRGQRARRVDEVLFTAFFRSEGKSARYRANTHVFRTQIAHQRRTHAGLIGVTEPITVVIPARECLDLTQRCLEHLAWYAGLPVEVIYVDNGSAAEVVEAVEACGERLGLALKVVRNATNEQFTRAVNQGIRLAGDRHVLVLNNDCFLGPDCLERLHWHLTRCPHRVAAVGPLTGDGGDQSLRHPRRRVQAGISPAMELDYNDALACAPTLRGVFRCIDTEVLAFFCTLLHREALSREGVLDEAPAYAAGLGADDEWCRRVRRQGWGLKLALDAYAVHLGSQSFRRLGIDRQTLSQVALMELARTGRAPKT